jgi:tryptophan-rich sensory protein
MQDTTFRTVLLVLIVMAVTVGVVLLLNNAQDSKWFNSNQRPPGVMPR